MLAETSPDIFSSKVSRVILLVLSTRRHTPSF
jgi:hypothetical protein